MRPDEGLTGCEMVIRCLIVDFDVKFFEVLAGEEKVEGQFIAHPPIGYRNLVFRIPHRVLPSGTTVKLKHILLAANGYRLSPVDPIDGIIDHHVGGDNLLILPSQLEMDMASVVFQNGPVVRVFGYLQE